METTDKLDQEIEQFFDRELLPLADRAKAKGVRFLQTDLAGDVPSYYVKRERRSMSKADFETGGCASTQTVAEDLKNLWKDDPEIGLAKLAPSLARLAEGLHAVEKDDGDVSSFIYVMY
jgi:hypothetical protein